APKLFVHTMSKLDKLKEGNLYPPFKHSVFTTAEWSFGDAASPPVTHGLQLFYTWCAITAIGDYPVPRGNVIFWKDENALPFIPGTTVVFPAGCQSHSFAAVEHHESRFYFKQYFNAALGRWVDKGLKSDTQFEKEASPGEIVDMLTHREDRAERATYLYSKVDDLFVV
ncbi:hypothetical protein C8J57DRAFT_1086059, partial [Mycena rebaudengoi]